VRPLNLLDIVEFLIRHGRRLALWTVGFAIAGYLVSYAIPSIYGATAVILPPEDDELAAALSASRRGVGALAGLGRLGGQYFTQADIALATLRSRSVHEQVVREFSLEAVYKAKTLEDAVRGLRENAAIRIGTDGTISVTVKDEDPKRAADIANAFLRGLDERNRDFRTYRARRTREFLEERVVQTDSLLRASEQRFVKYQGSKGTVVLSPDARGAADAVAGLMAQKVSAEVELSVMRGYASPRSEELQRLESRVRELSRQIGDLPSSQVGGASLLRQIAIHQALLGVLTTNLEEARIREVMDTPTIQVLDEAVPSQRRLWPRRLYIALFGGLVGLGLGLLAASGRLRAPKLAG